MGVLINSNDGLNEIYMMLGGSLVSKRDLLSIYIQIKENDYGSFEEWLVAGLQQGYVRELKEVDKL